MNEMVRRVKKLEEKADAKTGKRIEFLFIEPDEDEEEAERKWREENPGQEHEVTLYCVSWASETT